MLFSPCDLRTAGQPAAWCLHSYVSEEDREPVRVSKKPVKGATPAIGCYRPGGRLSWKSAHQ